MYEKEAEDGRLKSIENHRLKGKIGPTEGKRARLCSAFNA